MPPSSRRGPGETEDTTIVHLAIGWQVGQLKVGSFARGERMAKWNEAVRIEERLGPRARWRGRCCRAGSANVAPLPRTRRSHEMLRNVFASFPWRSSRSQRRRRSRPFPAGFRLQEVPTNGTTIHVRVGGSGPAVVLLHGYGETGDMWVPLAADLARDHTVIVPDLRGMGLSVASPPAATTRRPRPATSPACSTR